MRVPAPLVPVSRRRNSLTLQPRGVHAIQFGQGFINGEQFVIGHGQWNLDRIDIHRSNSPPRFSRFLAADSTKFAASLQQPLRKNVRDLRTSAPSPTNRIRPREPNTVPASVSGPPSYLMRGKTT
jgi:hypothetical protein